MLPKIPYAMEKNKSQSIPMRSINLGSAAEVGELSDSLGISTRKFPYLTVRRGDIKIDTKFNEYDGTMIRAMTVFNGEIVTVAENGGIYVGDKRVTGYDPGTYSSKITFSSINSKLVIYPLKKYIEKIDGKWTTGDLGAEVTLGSSTLFETDHIQAIDSRTKLAEGRAGVFSAEDHSFSIAPRTVNLAGLFGIIPEIDGTGDYTLVSLSQLGIGQYTVFNGVLEISYDMGLLITEGDRIAVANSSNKITNILHVSGVSLFDYGEDSRIAEIYFQEDYDEVTGYIYTITYNSQFSQYLKRGDWCAVYNNTSNGVIRGFVNDAAGLLRFASPSQDEVSAFLFSDISIDFTYWNDGALDKIIVGDKLTFTASSLSNSESYTVSEVTEDKIIFDEKSVIYDEVATNHISIIKIDTSERAFENFKTGDAVEITNCKKKENNTSFVISNIEDGAIFAGAEIFAELSSGCTVSRKIPNLDFICEKDNRIYGVNNSEKTIYVSALGDPTNMYAYEGISTDSFAVAVGGEGDFTTCCKYGEAVLFFKEDKLYKLTGSYPAEFALYSYDVDGVEAGSEKSCVIINEVLYYKGRYGVYSYTGGIPVLISECFGERAFTDAVAGTDGRYYYLSVIDEEKKPYLFTYDTRTQLWLIEQKVRCLDFARTREGLHYAGADGGVYKVGAGDASGEWLARWAPIYELIDGKRCYSRILARVSLPRGSYIIVKIRCDGGEWREAGKIVGKTEAVVPIRIPINRCDKFELELSGRGECTILDIMREFHVGSEV